MIYRIAHAGLIAQPICGLGWRHLRWRATCRACNLCPLLARLAAYIEVATQVSWRRIDGIDPSALIQWQVTAEVSVAVAAGAARPPIETTVVVHRPGPAGTV